MTTVQCLRMALLAATVQVSSICAEISLDSSHLRTKNVTAENVDHRGKKAVRVADATKKDVPDGSRFAVVPDVQFQDGVIELELAGDTLPGYGPEYRAFAGIAFRVSADAARYEAFYLRFKNGRSEDQAQRNHSAQYISIPDFPWRRLRQEFPAQYESYVDLVPGDWTKIKVEVHGSQARLFVRESAQPTLIVNDLKHGKSAGAIALWIDPGSVAHFANLKVQDH